MRPSRAAVGLLFGIVFRARVSATDLVIGHVPLRLGMPQSAALVALRKEFDVKQVSAEGTYMLWTRERETKVLYSAGEVSFRGEKLYRALKTWAKDGVKNMNDAPAPLFSALAGVGCLKTSPCKIRAETFPTPANLANGMDLDVVTIDAPPDRRVFVKMWKPHPNGAATPLSSWQIEECLMDVPASP